MASGKREGGKPHQQGADAHAYLHGMLAVDTRAKRHNTKDARRPALLSGWQYRMPVNLSLLVSFV